jgi:hypothetical protein
MNKSIVAIILIVSLTVLIALSLFYLVVSFKDNQIESLETVEFHGTLLGFMNGKDNHGNVYLYTSGEKTNITTSYLLSEDQRIYLSNFIGKDIVLLIKNNNFVGAYLDYGD